MKKYILKIGIIVLILMLIISGTYAYWTWNSTNNKNVVFSTAGISEYVIYDEGESYFVGDYQPYVNFCESVHTTLSIYKTSDALNMDLRATIKMDVNSIGDNISLSDNVYYVVTSGDSNITCNNGLSESNVIASGTFKGVSTDETLDLVNNIEVTTEEEKYTVWIWIDASGDDISSLSLETLDTNIWTKVDMTDGSSIIVNDDIVNVVVNDGMIPVTISDDGVVTTINENDNSWYDYTEQRWANAILVTNSSRNNYLNTSGVEVQESDILAYYVWIPRYKYRIWTKGISSTGKEQTIDIVFENKDTQKSNGTEVGEYLTHPAFTFGEEELDGFWVGKFETTGTGDEPTVLPNVQSLRNQNVSTQFQTSLKFSGGTLLDGTVYFDGNNNYGLTNNTNSHMMKNSEWGAVAYLSHSLYGINTEVRINNNYGYITGCGSSVENGNMTSECQVQYGNATEYPQSTTGNITGIYDMSSGSFESVMGVYSDSDGNPRSGYSSDYNSGFNGAYESGSKTDGIDFPSRKYYDLYLQSQFIGNYRTNNNYCTIDTCGGHALYEISGWYSDYSRFGYSSYPWFDRGGLFVYSSSSGIFFYENSSGSSTVNNTFRSVLTKTQYTSYYSINYDANGGSNAPSMQVINEDNPSISISNVIPTRSGYRFLNWNTEPDGTGITYRAGDTYNTSVNITLYAQWQELLTPTLTTSVSTLNIKMTSTGSGSFTYTYNGDGEISCTSSNANIATCSISNNVVYVTAKSTGDTTITLNSTSTSTYTVASSSVSINVSLQTYTISYDANGGSGAPSSQTKTYGVILTLSSTIPVRNGYTFLGWSTSSSATSATWSAGGSYKLNSDATLYAIWEEDKSGPTYSSYEVKNVTNSGYDVYIYGVSDPSGVDRVQFPTWTEYNDQDDLQSAWQTNSVASGTINGTTVYYRVNTTDHNGEAGIYITHVYLYDSLGNYFMFICDAINVPGITVNINSNNTNYGTVSPTTVSVGYGASYEVSNNTLIFPGGQIVTATATNIAGYTTSFSGWSNTSGTITDQTTITANFSRTINTYTVNYDANGGSGAPSSQTKTYGVTLTLSSTIPVRSGYTFLGWSGSPSATSATYASGGSYTTNSAITLYAVWEKNQINPITSYSCSNGSAGTSSYDLVYTGNCTVIDDGQNNWRVKFLTSGTLTVSSSTDIDIFLVGGGGGGGYSGSGEKHYGGGGGYTTTYLGYTLTTTSIDVTIGAGGAVFNSGGTSSFGTVASAAGGTSPTSSAGGSGGSGGGGLYWIDTTTVGGLGGSDGSNGGGTAYYGSGQGTTTREFGESDGTLYSGGGGAGTYGYCWAGEGGSGGGGKGACYTTNAKAGTANTGGGGGGGYFPSSEYGSAAAGGSGIVIIRNSLQMYLNVQKIVFQHLHIQEIMK